MHGTYIGRDRMLVHTTFGAKLLAAADDLSLMPDLVVSGQYDGPFVNYVQRELRSGNVALDVGANIGLFTLLMAWQVGITGAVVAYEPEPRNVALLQESVAMNYADRWVDVRPVAVGAEHGDATLHRTSRFRGSHSLLPFADEHLGADGDLDEIQVDVVPLDDLVGRFERIELVKVDVEGFEASVLRGARQLIASGVVRRFSLEIHRQRAGQWWEPLVEELRALAAAGWTFARIDEDGSPQAAELQTVVEDGWVSQLIVERL